ncbi:Urb2/Npa2 family-domain-containing protein [Hysterangium stoloniferum]|nr:Urb2/Npa2 family-domain-containing protein [Hysterangium stoloniferum]
MEDLLQSAQSFIRVLKSNNDTSFPSGLTKITIARAGWESKALYLPRKAGVVLEWLLPSIYKEHKDEANPGQLDLAYWDLLADILSDPGDTQIEPIILRFSAHVWINTFFATYAATPSHSREQLSNRFTHILHVVWPILIQRAGLDALTECVGSSFNVIYGIGIKGLNENLNAMFNLVLSGFTHSFVNSNVTARKKAYGTFCQHHFLFWLHAVSVLKITHPLGRRVYDLGTDVLYNPDSLRVALENNSASKTGTSISSVIFKTSLKDDPIARTLLVYILPHLCKSYALALRLHRSAIFTGSPLGTKTREQILQMTGNFLSEIWDFLEDLKEIEPAHIIWKTIADILQVVEEESLFDPVNSQQLTGLLERVNKEASSLLDYALDDSQSILMTHALDILSCLHRIEPGLIVSSVPHILQCIVIASSLLQLPAQRFLTQLILYYSKTRTLPTLVSLLFSALATPFSHFPHSDPLGIYRLCVCSSLLSVTFVNELTQAFEHFVTPGQAHELIILSSNIVSESLRQISQVSPQKRVKLDSQESKVSTGSTNDKLAASVSFALVSRFGASILRILISSNSKKHPFEARERYLEDMDTSISKAIRDAIVSLSQQLKSTPSLGKRPRPSHLERPQWVQHCLCASLLRFWYEVLDQETLHLNTSEVLSQLLSDVLDLMSEGIFPELQLEAGRTVLALQTKPMALQTTPATKDRPLKVVLDYIERNLLSKMGHIFSTSDANVSAFHDCAEKAALSLWGLLLERFLPALEASAPIEQLHRLVSFIARINAAAIFTSELETVIKRAFNSAYFWELPRLRESMSNLIETQTTAFASFDTAPLINAMVRGETLLIKEQIMLCEVSRTDAESAAEIFSLMHHFPPEYLSKVSKVDLVTRAMNADVYVSALNSDLEPMLRGVEWRAIFRSFISNSIKDTNLKMARNLVLTPTGMAYFALSPQNHAPLSMYATSTLDLMLAIQIATKGDDTYIKNTVDYFVAGSMFQEDQSFIRRYFTQFVEALINEFNPSSFRQHTLAHLHQSCATIEPGLQQALSFAVEGPDDKFSSLEDFIDAWHALISLKHWLGIAQSPNATVVNRQLFRRTVNVMKAATPNCPTVSDAFLAAVLSTLIIEVQTTLQTGWDDMGGMLAAYICFVSFSPSAMEVCNTVLSRACKSLSPVQYGHGLNLIREMLEDDNEVPSRLTIIVRLSTVFLRGAPEKTSKILYEHMSRCLFVFNHEALFTSGSSELRGHTLEFIQCHFTDRAATLKPSDAMYTLLILSKMLTGCPEHDAHTSTSIFKAIIYILDTMIRLRRDLLNPLLPQLAIVLRQLMTLVRCVRPHLGSKQHRLVADTLPRWINPSEALGSDDARALSRLLSAFTTKYLIRGYDTHEQKATSLARPFARHAPYVLLAYIQMMNDPLSMVAMSVRRELEPGLFSLCTMMGEHGRDTLMMQSLDVGGKALLKSIWKEYNKQRYIGRG